MVSESQQAEVLIKGPQHLPHSSKREDRGQTCWSASAVSPFVCVYMQSPPKISLLLRR